MKALGLVMGVFVIGCGARPLAIEADAGGVGAGGAVTAGAGGESGAGRAGDGGGGVGVGGAVETGCAFVDPAQTEDCGAIDTLSLAGPQVDDYGTDGRVSAGEAATFSITLAAGDQAFSYPAVGLTSDNPLVTIAPPLPETFIYALNPHLEMDGAFDFLVDPSVVPGTVVHFTACPGRLGKFCRGGPRASFDVTVQPKIAPTWTTAPGRPAGSISCGIGTSNIDRVCAGLDKVTWSNPRATFFVIGPSMYVSTAAWLTNTDGHDHVVCVKAAAGDRASIVAYPNVAAGKSAGVAFGGIDLGPPLASGTRVHFAAWTGSSGADCPNATRVEFDATVP